jgi:hypothetical protein
MRWITSSPLALQRTPTADPIERIGYGLRKFDEFVIPLGFLVEQDGLTRVFRQLGN